ncbi:uncharacterized protein LOC117318593, partial [Pecten maximus]|uniref:uncharacterized protein LOC117318593 n=1 Tax=Pecten maximus TaxID=6579 RepID=UPI001457E7B5
MASDNFRESLQPFCIEVEGFPPDTNENQVKQIFQNCLKLERIVGVQLNQTKWLILFHDKVVTDYYVSQKEICLPNSTPLKIGACILCDIPASWGKVDLKAFRTVDKSQGMYHGRDGGNRHTRTFGNDKQEEMDNQAAETEEEENEADDEEEDEESLGMIKVTGISPQTTEESLTSFFGSKRKSGGGDIEVVDFREESAMAIITFEKPEVVDRVLQKLPLLLDKKQITVERFVPEKYNSGANVEKETSDKEESKPSCIIEVRRMSEKTSLDTIELYFGNKKAAGKNVEVVNVNDSEFDEGVVYITYETEE